MAVNNYRKISEGPTDEKMEEAPRTEMANIRTGEGKRREQTSDGAEPSGGPWKGARRPLTLFPRRSLQRLGIMKRARGFRQWEGKKITSKLAAHLNLDNPKTVVLHARRAGSDVSLIIAIAWSCSAISGPNLAPSVALLYW